MNRLLCSIMLGFFLSSAFAEPILPDRVNDLPSEERRAWKAYVDRSVTNAQTDIATVQEEVVANKMTNALRAPSGGDLKLHTKTGDAWYAGDEAKKLTEAILSYQTPSGGWSKHLGYSRGPRKPGMQWTSQNAPDQSAHYVATFDNGSTTTEMDFLANVWLATKRADCQAGFIKGLEFIFAAQFPNGGWPQVYPLEGGYHDYITFNDDAMTHVLELLKGIGNHEPRYAFVDEARRKKAAEQLVKGIGCVLKTQVVQGGKKTVWCGQHDALTLQPASARKMEPATLSGLESAHILKFLMTITDPTPEIVASIESGLKWFEAAKISGEMRTDEKGKSFFEPVTLGTEVRWARFYNLTNSKSVFPGRDGILYDTYATMIATNRGGYDYYTSQPGSIVRTAQNKWRKMLASKSN